MKITIKLFATFEPYLPSNREGHAAELELSEKATISEAIAKVKVPDDKVHLILVNGIYVSPDIRATHVLSENDVLALWPAVAGG
ncbi:MAG: MoaD/ThiS family protein [Gammaproteobacteria bacterium]|nr:MAG: MoaD/ThiS family protein [Gammaproteobacteria bacterium]RLA24040.1 MAG: MoaD/ThiS family protein [Gammaproteobacteria bacterium]